MHVIAASTSLRTEWAIVEGTTVTDRAVTEGLNPFFHTRRELSHIVRLNLPEQFFRRRWDHVYFYGAGCSSPEKNKIVESSLIAQFKTPTSVYSDLLGAARGMLIDKPGLVAILSTGANSCLYDGKKIVKNVRPGGFILGDEGSNAYFGKLLLSDVLKNLAPSDLIDSFYEYFGTTADGIMDVVYSSLTNIRLAEYSGFLAEHLDREYCRKMIYDGFINFFRRNINAYDFHHHPLAIVGTTGVRYREILLQAAKDFGITISKIEESSLPGLIEYHRAVNNA